MKLMFASDIHGSLGGCKAVFDRFEAEKPEKLILLGDLLYHGPRNDIPEDYAPKQVIELLNDHAGDILCVRGNCDAEVDQMVLSFPIMSDSLVLWLREPLKKDDGVTGDRHSHMAYCTHGHLCDPEALPLINPGDIVISGHTHLYRAEKKNGIYYVNTGSVSLPKGGNPPTYATYKDGVFEIKTTDGRGIASLVITRD